MFEYPDAAGPGRAKQLIFEQRIWSPYVQEGYENGAAFYGTEGLLIIGHSVGWTLYGPKNKKIAERTGPADLAAHHQNFLDCVRGDRQSAQRRRDGRAPCGDAGPPRQHRRAVGRVLDFDPQTETIVGDNEAAALVARRYREGHWAVPRMG